MWLCWNQLWAAWMFSIPLPFLVGLLQPHHIPTILISLLTYWPLVSLKWEPRRWPCQSPHLFSRWKLNISYLLLLICLPFSFLRVVCVCVCVYVLTCTPMGHPCVNSYVHSEAFSWKATLANQQDPCGHLRLLDSSSGSLWTYRPPFKKMVILHLKRAETYFLLDWGLPRRRIPEGSRESAREVMPFSRDAEVLFWGLQFSLIVSFLNIKVHAEPIEHFQEP